MHANELIGQQLDTLQLYGLQSGATTSRAAASVHGVWIRSSGIITIPPKPVNGQFTAFIQRFSNQWPVKLLYHIAQHSRTDGSVSIWGQNSLNNNECTEKDSQMGRNSL